MKTIFRLLCGLMAIALTTACSHEELLQTEPVQKPAEGKMVSVKAYTPSEQPASRLAFNDQGTEGLKLSWSEGDDFTSIVSNYKVTFTYDANTKEFSSNLPEDAILTDGVKAYYPSYIIEYIKDLSQQTGALNSATTYMEGAYDATAQAFRFTHSTAILKVAFSGLPDGAEIESISIVGAGGDITISNPNATINKEAVYINLLAIAKDTKLKFDVRTTDGRLYIATKTVAAEEGIKIGVYYNTTVALQEACLLPKGSVFNAAIKAVNGYSDVTSIILEANSTETGGTQIGSSTAYAKVVGTTLKIYTAANEFVFNENCSSMFYNLTKIQSIDFGNCVNTEKVTNMSYMFHNCERLVSLDVSNFNTANVTDMSDMFSYCARLSSLDLSSFNTANVTDMNSMFFDCYALSSLDLSSFDFSKVTNFEYMFDNLGSSASNNKLIPVYVTMAGYEILKNKLTYIPISATYVYPCELPTGSTFNAAVNSFLESNSSLTKIKFIANSDNTNKDNPIGTSGAYMVTGGDNETLEIHTAAAEFVFNANCYNMFDGLSTITAIDFNDCVNTLNVTNMGSIFYGCSALTSLDLSSFNTANVTNMGSMFNGCSALTSLNLSGFNTANVTNMGAMFYKCSSLESLDLSGFNTEKVEYMNSMFYDCKKLSSLNVSSFNTANVTAMVSMFDSCSALESLDLSNFNTANVTNMYNMFSDCASLTSLDLSSFDFSQVTDFEYMFDYLGSSATNKPIPIYVTQAGYNILKDKNTYYTYRYFQYVDKDGNPYSL